MMRFHTQRRCRTQLVVHRRLVVVVVVIVVVKELAAMIAAVQVRATQGRSHTLMVGVVAVVPFQPLIGHVGGNSGG
jgi:hypothetical protein